MPGNVSNYLDQGGALTHIGGTLNVEAGGVQNFVGSGAMQVAGVAVNLTALANAVADTYSIAPATELLPVPVTNITYVIPIVPPAAPANQSCIRATAAAAATAIIQCDLSDLLSRTTAGKGLTVTSLTAYWTLTTQVLTAGPSCTINTATFATAAAAAGVVAVSAVAGGTITTVPVATQTAIPTAGQFYGTQFVLGTPLALNSALVDAYAEISFPCTNGSILYVSHVAVAYNNMLL